MAGLGVQSVLSAGVAAALGAAMVLAPPDHHSGPSSPIAAVHNDFGVTLSAATLPLPSAATREGAPLVAVKLLPKASSLGAETVVPEASSAGLVSTASAGGAIITVYDAVEPWVAWGFDVAQYAVGWIPVVGWLAPQIGILYDFGESITASVVFNFANWIDGNVTFSEGIGNIVRDSWNATVQLGYAELAWILPPLPPWPPIWGRVAAVEPAAQNRSVTDDAAGQTDDVPDAADRQGEATGDTDAPTEEPPTAETQEETPATDETTDSDDAMTEVTEETPDDDVTEDETTDETPVETPGANAQTGSEEDAEPATTQDDAKDAPKADAPKTDATEAGANPDDAD